MQQIVRRRAQIPTVHQDGGLSLPLGGALEGSEELARKNCIIPRAGSPADVGAGVAYLASREAEWVTGQIVPLNGGGITA